MHRTDGLQDYTPFYHSTMFLPLDELGMRN
jgi:hypothetical protein